MQLKDRQVEFIRILEYAYRRGTESSTVTTQQLVEEITIQLEEVLNHNRASNQNIF